MITLVVTKWLSIAAIALSVFCQGLYGQYQKGARKGTGQSPLEAYSRKTTYQSEQSQRFGGFTKRCADLKSPVNGRLRCATSQGVYTCTATCFSGYYFSDGIDEVELRCNANTGEWTPYSEFQDCVGESGGEYMSERYSQYQDGGGHGEYQQHTPSRYGYSDYQQQQSNFGSSYRDYEENQAYSYLCKSPQRFVNGQMSCSGDSYKLECQGTCSPGYEFPDGSRQKVLTCTKADGIWVPQDSFEGCKPLCHPPCENAGVCSALNQCMCRPAFRGNRCQYPVSLCDFSKLNARMVSFNCSHSPEFTECYVSCPPGMTFDPPTTSQYRCTVDGLWNPPNPPSCVRDSLCEQPPSPMNGRLSCTGNNEVKMCKATCMSGFLFPNGFTEMVIQCPYISGQWTPDVNFPDCKPICNPECRNGGRCVGHNQCICPNEYRGARCEYPTANCNAREFLASVSSKCEVKADETVCKVSCHGGATLDPPEPLEYSCGLDGQWVPDIKPTCISDYNLDLRGQQRNYQEETRTHSYSSQSTQLRRQQYGGQGGHYGTGQFRQESQDDGFGGSERTHGWEQNQRFGQNQEGYDWGQEGNEFGFGQRGGSYGSSQNEGGYGAGQNRGGNSFEGQEGYDWGLDSQFGAGQGQGQGNYQYRQRTGGNQFGQSQENYEFGQNQEGYEFGQKPEGYEFGQSRERGNPPETPQGYNQVPDGYGTQQQETEEDGETWLGGIGGWPEEETEEISDNKFREQEAIAVEEPFTKNKAHETKSEPHVHPNLITAHDITGEGHGRSLIEQETDFGWGELDAEVVSSFRGVCSAWGFPHYRTFDGAVFTFPGTCKYVLVSDCDRGTFTVTIQPNCLGESQSIAEPTFCIHEVEIKLHSGLYHLSSLTGLSSEGRSLPIPTSTAGLSVEKVSRYLVARILPGFSIWLDNEGSVHVSASRTQRGQLCGLCGNYDDDYLNDFVSPYGDKIYDVTTFGNSWKTVDSNVDCIDAEPHVTPCRSDTVQQRLISEKASLTCSTVRSLEYEYCHKFVDPDIYYRKCEMDCCLRESATGCECNALNEYFLECGRLATIPGSGWRTPALCPLACHNGTVYQQCGPTCSATCSNLEPTCQHERCVDGCHCPSGTVLEEGHCIPVEACPCTHGSKKYASGETMSSDCNTCLCQGGQWQCTEEICPGTCSVSGPHYTTFDGVRFQLYASCPHYLIDFESPTQKYSVIIDYSDVCGYSKSLSSIGCVKSLTIHTPEGATVRLKPGFEVTVNGREMTSLPVSAPGAYIGQATSMFIRAQLSNGLQILWNGRESVYIDAPVELFGLTRGLCGTYTRNQADDFLTPEGDIELTSAIFARKWKLDEECVDLKHMEESVCDEYPHSRQDAVEKCSILRGKVFEECHGIVDPDPYYTACVEDICQCQADFDQCFCSALGSYGSACSRKGVPLFWRSAVPDCAVHCDFMGQIYEPCASTCSYSCAEISQADALCQSSCVEGCVCPSGMTMDMDIMECVPVSSCSCMHSGRMYPPEFLQRRGGEMCECYEALWDCREASASELILTPPPNIAPECLASLHQLPTDCASHCPITCSNWHHHQPCTVVTCQPGCKCEEGYVLHSATGTCVRPEDCPCHHGGKSYEGGTELKMDCNSCVCTGGQWKCETKPCPGLCSAWGDSHYKTFDGKMFDFQGECDYVLVRGHVSDDVTVSVLVQNIPCGAEGVTCSKSVVINLGDYDITLTKDVPLPPVEPESRLKLSQLGKFILVHSDVGISVQWDRGTRVYVIAEPVWKSKLQGLCGDFNSDSTDDFMPPSGGIPLVLPQDFADSWRVHDYCLPSKHILDTCTDRPERLKWAREKCSVLTSELFEPCHSQVESEEYYRRCLFDTCACNSGGDCACFCTVVAAYAQECARHDIIIPWRSQDLCPIQCESCDRYSPCISLCPPVNCETLNDDVESHTCNHEPCVEGCIIKPCPPGHVRASHNNLTCVKEEDCSLQPCGVFNGVAYREGEKINDPTIGDACQSCYCRHGLPDCVGVPCTSAPPIPTVAPHIQDCEMTGWTEWINSISPEDNDGSDREDLESLVYDRRVPCPLVHVASVQCRDVLTAAPPESTGEDVICNVQEGMVCHGSVWNPCSDYEMRIYCDCAKEEICPPEQFWEDCAFNCDNVCHSLRHDLLAKGHCDENDVCVAGCSKILCEPPYVSRDPETCVLPEMCTCRLESGYLLAPGEVVKNGCEKCQCLNNSLICSTLKECEQTTSTIKPVSMILGVGRSTIPVPRMSLLPAGITEAPITTTPRSLVVPPLGVTVRPAACAYWSDWINRSRPRRGKKRGDREDTLPFILRQTEGFCKEGSITEIECREAKKDLLYTETEELKLTCDLQFGFVCNNADQPDSRCMDYKIRYFCSCAKEETTPIFLKPTTPSHIYPCNKFVQLINGVSPLPDSRLRASSSVSPSAGPQSARLPAEPSQETEVLRERAWTASLSNEQQFIEVDLGDVRAIYGVITKGKANSNEWVTSYYVLYSTDGASYSYYSDDKDKPVVFSANYDDSSESVHIFQHPFEAKFVRIEPLSWEGAISLRFDLYGCSEAIESTTPIPGEYITTVKPFEKVCEDPMGLENGLISDFQLSASSWYDDLHTANEARLGSEDAWVPRVADEKQYVQVDFLEPQNITGIITRGRTVKFQWVTAYYVSYSNNGIDWDKVSDESGKLKEFPANYDAESLVTNLLASTVRTRYLRIIPTKYKNWPSLQFEVLGCFHPVPCQEPMGIEDGRITKYQLSASSEYNDASTASNARLDSVHGWSPSASDRKQFLQVDFVKPMNITAVVTRGRHDFPKWVTRYQVAVSDDGINFKKIRNQQGTIENFSGNTDKDTAVTQLLPETVRARFLRILPVKWKGAIGIRFDVLGCYEEQACMEEMGLENGLISNGQLSGSSYKELDLSPANARINDPAGWSPATLQGKQYLQVDFLAPRDVSAIVTKGRGDEPQWVTEYSVSYSNDTYDWSPVLDPDGHVLNFLGNADQDTPVVNLLGDVPIKARYFRIIPTDFENWISMRLEILGCYHPYECQEPMGLENGMIADTQLTASSSRAATLSPSNARIDSDTAWSSAVLDDNQFLQVDFMERRNLTGLVTLGRNDAAEWITSYFIAYSDDGVSWDVIKEDETEDIMEFPGNYDSDSPVSARFPEPITARFLKIVPIKWEKWMSLRLEVLGCYHPYVCKETMGIENGMITDSQISASSYYNDTSSPAAAQLSSESSWSAADVDDEQYLQVDFDSPRNITAVVTKGQPNSDKWVEAFQIAYSYDKIHWFTLSDIFGEPKEFPANKDSDTPVITVFPETIEAQYLRVIPTLWNKWISMRLEILGCSYTPTVEVVPVAKKYVIKKKKFPKGKEQVIEELEEEVLPLVPTELTLVGECPDPSDVEGDLLDLAEITATSSAPTSSPSLVKLSIPTDTGEGMTGGWVPSVGDLHPVLIIQFPEDRLLTAIRTQGRADDEQWVKTLRVIASTDNYTWFPVFGPNGDELIEANDDQNTVNGHYFKEPVVAKFVKVMPESWHRWPSFRMELIGCYHPSATTTSVVGLTSTAPGVILTPVELCPELDLSFLSSCPRSCPEGLVCDGEGCIDPVDCVCMHNGEVFKVGDRIEDEYCMQCDCALGGNSVCNKKTCPPCPQGQKQTWTHKCECECTECNDAEVLCVSNGACIPEEKWCDGITDCPDDEKDCISTTVSAALLPQGVRIQTETVPEAILPLFLTTTEVPLKPGNDTCEILGRHIKTLDDQNLNYEHCHHIALKDIQYESFTISIHKYCEPHTSCIHWIEVLTDEHQLKVTSDLDVKLDNHQYSAEQLVLLNRKLNSNMTIEKIGDQVVVKLSNIGIKIIYDILAHLKIQVPSTMWNNVSGLCGYYSGDASDDQKKPNGHLAYTSQEFGDSWASESHTTDCVPVLCPHEIMSEALELCNQLKESPFAQCGDVLNIDTHVEFCMSSVCECLQKRNASIEKCKCDNFLPLVEACEEKVGTSPLRNWRLKVGCTPECPEGMTWNDCGPSCQLTCDTPSTDNLDMCTEECMAGCFCPDGMLQNGKGCVSPDKCSDKMCQGFGDPFLETFDGFFFPFQAEGTFLIVADKGTDFSIEAITRPCSLFSSITCVIGIKVTHNGHTAVARRSNVVHVDDQEFSINDLPKIINGLTILGFPGQTYIFLIPKLSIAARFYGESSGFAVKIPSRRYFNRTIGLCGNCDARIEDELQNNPLSEYVCSWMTEGNPEECKEAITEMRNTTGHVEACDNLMDNMFSSCHILVDPKNYIDACNYDSSNNGDERVSLCKTLREYSRQCCQAGIVINDWPFKFNCSIECDEGLVFSQCHDGCPQTCDSVTSQSPIPDCGSLKIDGCFCPEGKALKDGSCVDLISCETCDDEGHVPGDTWQDGPCKKCSCSENLLISCNTESCPAKPICKSEDESLVKQESDEDSCCDSYTCVPAPALCTTLEDVPKCPEGQVAKVKTGEDFCPEFKCECDPLLCAPIVWPSDLEEGQVAEVVKDSCCSKVAVVCKEEKCPEEPQCKPGLELIEMEGECCSLYKCKPPTDVCIYTQQYEVEDGHQLDIAPSERETVTYKLGDIWQDGLCENCSCIENNGQLVPQCVREQCPSLDTMAESKDYDLQTIAIPWKCCPDIFRLQCKDDSGNLYLPDEEWQSNEDPCVKFTCEISPLGDVRKVRKVIDCPECPKTSDYIPPSKKLGQCCGICRPSKCEEEGEIYSIGEVWSSKLDSCRTAECVSDWGNNIHIVYTKASCPTIPDDCPKEKIIPDEKGCCQICNATSELSCNSAPIPLEETVGFFTYYDSSRGGFCKNDNPVSDVLRCKGACHSEEYYSLEDGDFTGNCKCCKVNITVDRTIELSCPDGSHLRKSFLQPETCQCSKCAPKKDKDVWIKGKPERIQKSKTSFRDYESPWQQEPTKEEQFGFEEQKPVFQSFEGDEQQKEVDFDLFQREEANKFGRYEQEPVPGFETFQQEPYEQEQTFGDFFQGQEPLREGSSVFQQQTEEK